MISAFDRTFKLGVLLSVIDWLTFNIVFLSSYYASWLPFLDWNGHFATCMCAANAAYIIALQFVTISLHHRQAQPAKVLSNTSRTSVMFIVLYTSFLGIFTSVDIPDFWASLYLTLIIFAVTTIERLLLRTFINRMRNSGHDTVKAVILGTNNMMQRVANIMLSGWNGYNLLGYFADKGAQPLVDPSTNESIKRLGNLEDIMRYIGQNRVDELYLNEVPNGQEGFKALMQLCDKNMVRVYYVPSAVYGEFRKAKVKEFGDTYVLSQYDEPTSSCRCCSCAPCSR